MSLISLKIKTVQGLTLKALLWRKSAKQREEQNIVLIYFSSKSLQIHIYNLGKSWKFCLFFDNKTAPARLITYCWSWSLGFDSTNSKELECFSSLFKAIVLLIGEFYSLSQTWETQKCFPVFVFCFFFRGDSPNHSARATHNLL